MKRPRIVLIEDDTWVQQQHARVLGTEFEVHAAANALEGIDAIDRIRPDAIVLDIFMPGPNGVVLLHEIRSHVDLAIIPIILATNNAAEISLAQMKPYGVVEVLDKTTMHPEDLPAAIRKALS